MDPIWLLVLDREEHPSPESGDSKASMSEPFNLHSDLLSGAPAGAFPGK
jgi:hypothetical protein